MSSSGSSRSGKTLGSPLMLSSAVMVDIFRGDFKVYNCLLICIVRSPCTLSPVCLDMQGLIHGLEVWGGEVSFRKRGS